MATISPQTLIAFRKACDEGTRHARARAWPAAAAAFGRATSLVPAASGAWRALGNVHHAMGDHARANAAHLHALTADAADPALIAADKALAENRLSETHGVAKARLEADRTDIVALRLMAELALRAGRPEEAVKLLLGALELAPGFVAGWASLTSALRRLPIDAALATVRARRAARPDVSNFVAIEATLLEQAGDYDGAIAAFEAIVAARPGDASTWIALGHARRTLGQTDAAIDAYRRGITARPLAGDGWWALADLKTYRFSAEEAAAMQALAARADLPPAERPALEFALARAAEVACEHETAFGHYAQGNRLKRAQVRHDRDEIERDRAAMAALFTRDFFAAREGWGCPARDPIFIVGMPRSGSTLVEQILASHPQIEATRELTDLSEIVRTLTLTAPAKGSRYPAVLDTLPPDEIAALGRTYLDRARAHRRTDRARFVDKMPVNFLHVGLIRLILPDAKVIDVRRDARASGFSIFKQYFARGYGYAWSLDDIAAFRRGYVRIMDDCEAALPGFVHRLDYQALVTDTEGEVRRLLDYLELQFDPACLRFHETDRPVRTPSGEQVRRPVNAEGLDAWRPYAAWLGALGG